MLPTDEEVEDYQENHRRRMQRIEEWFLSSDADNKATQGNDNSFPQPKEPKAFGLFEG